MAKQAVSPIERHLEKGVLGLGLLVLAGAVVRFLIASPNTIDLGGQMVTPAQVYQNMAAEAEDLRNRVRNKKPEEKVAASEFENIKKLLEAEPESPALALAVPFGPVVPDWSAKKLEEGAMELVSVLPMDKPAAMVGRSGAEIKPPDPVSTVPDEIKPEAIDSGYVVPVNWVTLSALFDVSAQRQLAESRKYLPGQAVPYIVGAELQRREKRWDGSYTDWETVPTYAPWVLPELPFVEVVEQDGKFSVPEAMVTKVDAFRRDVEEGWLRVQLVRPLPPAIAYGDWWDPPKLEGLDLARMDDDIIFPPPEESACPYIDRYPKKPTPKPTKDENQDERLRKELNRRVEQIEAWLKQGCYEACLNSVDDLLKFSGKDIQRLDPKKFEWLNQQKDELDKIVEKRKKEGIPKKQRELLPQQLVWVHDAMAGSVLSGKTYQYRMRALMFNNLCTLIPQLKNPKDAEIVLLQGEWSPESADVVIPSDTEFFLVREKEQDKTARVEVFKWHEGERVRAQFDVSVGSPIGDRASVKVVNAQEQARVDFATGCRVVDLRFDHPYRDRKEKRTGFELADPKPTLAMIYVDAQGDLHQRIMEDDKSSPRLKELKEMLAAPPPPKP